jgi:curli biogenesis system outer membrane secretion channel CsgG
MKYSYIIKKISILTFAAIIIISSPGCMTKMIKPAKPLPDVFIPPVISVTTFDNLSNFSGQWKLGDGMADLLTSELIISQNFVVVDRQQLHRIVGEIDMQRDPHFRKEGQTDAGRLKGASYLIRGVINDFSQTSGSSLWFRIKNLLLGGNASKARVSLTLTIIDVESGEIIDSVKGSAYARARGAYVEGEYEGVKFGGDAFFATPIGIATANAIRSGVKEIINSLPHKDWEPMIAKVSLTGQSIIINGGKNRGFQEEVIYSIREKGQPVTDPSTGDTLSILPGTIIGTIKITTVEDKISYAIPLSGKNFKRGLIIAPFNENPDINP